MLYERFQLKLDGEFHNQSSLVTSHRIKATILGHFKISTVPLYGLATINFSKGLITNGISIQFVMIFNDIRI